jgi:lysophospholipase L1-like esterase
VTGWPGPPRRRLRSATALLGAALLVSGCSSGGSDPHGAGSTTPSSSASTSPAGSPYHRFVALGDSYSAGPLIPTTDLAGGCARSDHNYPSLLAKRLGVASFVDVTCSAATTRDLTHVQATFGDARIPPQLRSLTRGTDLVTLGIGGNDLNLFSTLISTCTRLRATDPTGSPCARRIASRGPDLEAATATISSRVSGSLREIRRRAPHATVVLVGYLRLVPARGTCAQLPLATGDYAVGRRISRLLDQALQRAARRTKVTFVDMDAASAGHDVCSADPWVNGSVTDRQKALAYHPLASGMRADAARILAALPGRP